jgi:phage protein Gp37/Gp68
MSDLFHERVPDEFINSVFEVMERSSLHTFQLLTKRSSRLAEWTAARYSVDGSVGKRWPRNIWAGVSVESEFYTSRIRDLQTVPSSTRFLSVEPLLGPVALNAQRLARRFLERVAPTRARHVTRLSCLFRSPPFPQEESRNQSKTSSSRELSQRLGRPARSTVVRRYMLWFWTLCPRRVRIHRGIRSGLCPHWSRRTDGATSIWQDR